MDRIISIDGALADSLGTIGMRAIAKAIAGHTQQPVTIITHGATHHHGATRIRSECKDVALARRAISIADELEG